MNPLKERDYTVIFAKAPLSPRPITPDYRTYWQAAYSPLMRLAINCETLAKDGLTLYLGDGKTGVNCHRHVKSPDLEDLLAEIFPPDPLDVHTALQVALDDYFDRKQRQQSKANGEIILVLIDQEPRNRMALAKLIIAATQRIDSDRELGIGLIQVGTDPITRGFLDVLDEELQKNGALFDIVHTQMLNDIPPEGLLQFLIDVLDD